MRTEGMNLRLLAVLLAIFLAWWVFFLVGGLPMTDPEVLAHTVPILAAWLLGGAAVHGFARVYADTRSRPGDGPTTAEARWHRLAESAAGGVSLVIAEYFLLSLFVLVDPAARAAWPPIQVKVHVFTLIAIGVASLGYFYAASRQLLAIRREAAAQDRPSGDAAGSRRA